MIDQFSGEYRWLSNFYLVDVEMDGVIYPSVEHAYQAAKTTDEASRKYIHLLQTPAMAKRAGRKVPLRSDWEKVKLDVMRRLLMEKFTRGDLRKKLLATGDTELIEGNWWGDTFWGVCRGVGENHLGKLLMEVREYLRDYCEQN